MPSFYFGDPPEKKAELLHGKDLHEFSYSMKMDSLGFNYSAYDYFKEEKIQKSSKSHSPNTDNYLSKSKNASEGTFTLDENFYYNFPATKGKSDQELDSAVKTDKFGRVTGLNLAKGTSENSELTLGGKLQVKGIVDTGTTLKTTDYGDYRIISLYHSCDEAGNYINHF